MWILNKIEKISQILQTNHKKEATLQVKHQLHFYMFNGGTNLRTQSAKHLVSNYLFKLLHDFQSYNNQGKKEKHRHVDNGKWQKHLM